MGVLRAVVAGLALASCAIGGIQTPLRGYGAPKLVARLASKEIGESSGVARSYRYPGTYYTHNDSGDSARFWRFELSGKCEGPFTIAGATALDWEDAASARIEGKDYVYLADIGDNFRRRSSIVVYRIVEPAKGQGRVNRFDTFELSYPDGPHDAETLLVHPKTGEIAIVLKEIGREPRVYGVEAKKGGSYKLKLLGRLRGPRGGTLIPLVTGGDVSPDGRYVVVRNYAQAFEYGPVEDFRKWFDLEPRVVLLREEPQGEAVAYSLDGKALVTTSEGVPCEVSVVPLDANGRPRSRR